MKLKFRLVVYAVVSFLIPLLIWLVYGEFPLDSWLWIAFCLVIVGVYELINGLRKK